MDPTKYIFAFVKGLSEEIGSPTFGVVSREYFEKEGWLNEADDELCSFMGTFGFAETQEGIFEPSVDTAFANESMSVLRARLEEIGLTYSPELGKVLDEEFPLENEKE